ncbi:MAG: septum site-determining protein MinD, partial [Clostridia bacterium]|nr:septum site-determining protein MinD [Clostridia bacterium]
GLLEANEINQTDLIVNRLRLDMIRRGDMMSVDDVVEILAIPLLGAIPDDESIVIATNQGEPLAGTNTAVGKIFTHICKKIMDADMKPNDLNSNRTIWNKMFASRKRN